MCDNDTVYCTVGLGFRRETTGFTVDTAAHRREVSPHG